MAQLELKLEAEFKPGDRVQLRSGVKATVRDPSDIGRKPMATHTLIQKDHYLNPVWIQTNLLKRIGG